MASKSTSVDQLRTATIARIRHSGIIPIVRVPSAEQAFCAVEGIVAAGIDVIEITLTIPNALQTIETLSKRYGDELLVGAGTVLDAETCRSALLAGAQFIVSPALDNRVVEEAHRNNKICMPGALTPTEVLAAWQAGADLVKIFPCGLFGGPKYIRALKGPFPHISFVPTAGVDVDNIAEFLAAGAVAVGVGEKIFTREALEAGNVDLIYSNACRFVEAIQSAGR